MKALENYLRTHRKAAGLTQREVAYLLGMQSASKVSRYEHFDRRPPLETAIAYEIVFAIPIRELFAGVHEHVEHEVKKRARRLHHRLAHQDVHRRKLAALNALTKRSDDITYEPVQ